MRGRFLHHVISTFGISILQQFVGLGRQILIAAFFGLSRSFDGFLVVFSVATMLVFNLSSVFDTVAVARLVQIRERDGEAAFWKSSNRLLLQAAVGGVVAGIVFLAVFHLVLPIVAAGFSATERAEVENLSWYFAPWIAMVIPYYAV